MSGRPNPEGVKQLLKLLDERATLCTRIGDLKPLAEELRTCETRMSNICIEIGRQLESMDVDDTQKGHYGHEARVAALVVLLRDAIREEAKPLEKVKTSCAMCHGDRDTCGHFVGGGAQ